MNSMYVSSMVVEMFWASISVLGKYSSLKRFDRLNMLKSRDVSERKYGRGGGDVSAHMLKITTFLSLVVFLFSGKILTEPKMTVGGEYLTPSPAMVSELATSSSTTAE